MRLRVMSVGDMETNGYIVSDEKTNEGIIIDAGAEPEKFIAYIEESNIKPKAILLTHSHYDHITACGEIKGRYNIPVLICENEDKTAESETVNLSRVFGNPMTLEYDRILKDGEKFSFGELELEVMNTPGHTPGSACFYFEKEGVLFSGDTLFCMSIGRTDFPLGSSEQIIASLKKLSNLPEDTKVYPGHGQHTTIGQEKKINPYMKQR